MTALRTLAIRLANALLRAAGEDASADRMRRVIAQQDLERANFAIELLQDKLRHSHEECSRLRAKLDQHERTQRALQAFAVGRMEN